MSLYGMLHGRNDNSASILGLLDVEGFIAGDFDWGRPRDVRIEDGEYVVVHTRNGRGNRLDYKHVFKAVRRHPYYSHDKDCDHDGTYADIYFKIPSEKTGFNG